jgi:hypothetical protein
LWHALADDQNVIHEKISRARAARQCDTAAVAAAAAAAGATVGASETVYPSPITVEMGELLGRIQTLQDSGAAEAAALCRAVLRGACDSTCSAIEAGAVEMGQSKLPASELQIVESVFAAFKARYQAFPNMEDGAVSGVHTVASAQKQSWWPAYLTCLLDPKWPIPGFSPEMSDTVKVFLESIAESNFWTFHVFEAAVPSPAQDPVRDECIECTTYEKLPFLFTVQGMDHWRRVRPDQELPSRALYWPGTLFSIIIGPHLINVAIGCRLMHGTAAVLSDWATVTCGSPIWNKYTHAHTQPHTHTLILFLGIQSTFPFQKNLHHRRACHP